MTVSYSSKKSDFKLCEFRPAAAGELAEFLNELHSRYWTLTSSAYQRKPANVRYLTGDALLQESSEHPHRIGHYLLRHRSRIIASLKIDDKFGDGNVAVLSDLETHPDFQRRGLAWFYFLPCLRHVIEMDFQMIELETWVFNRKGIPLYKRCGFRAVPGTSLLMENYLPIIVRHPALRPYFQRHDYIRTLRSRRSYGFDHFIHQDLIAFQYRWEAGGEMWEVLVDFPRKQVASIACLEWSIGAWVVRDRPLKVLMRVENRSNEAMVCQPSDGNGEEFAVLKDETKQKEWDVSDKDQMHFSVRVGRLCFPFSVRQDPETSTHCK